jgi:predicted permease
MTVSFGQLFYVLRLRLRSLFRREQVNRELDDELRDHLERQTEQNLAKGMSPAEARRAARLSLGSVGHIEEQCYEARGVNFIETLVQDLRYGIRQLWRNPGFSALAILCLALGIGANAAVFSWVEGILFRPYPAVAHQEQLLALAGTAVGDPRNTEMSWPDYLDLQNSCTVCNAFFVSKITGSTLNVGDHAEVTTGSIVSANYFDAIGVPPLLGRGFQPGEDTGHSAHPVVVISYQLWQDRFKGDPQIIGKLQRLNNVPHTIIGVTPADFRGTFVGWAMNFWVPASMEDTLEGGAYKLDDRSARWIEAYIRLKPGATRAQAQQQISAAAARLESAYPATNRGIGFRLYPLWQTPFNNAATLLPTLQIMTAVVAFVLLIACANVSNLLLVRSFARRQEITVRLAIGASRARLSQQLLTEGLILAVLGAGFGLLLAYWSRYLLAHLLPARSGIRMYLPGQIDWRVMALSALVCVLATLLVGLVPAFQTRDLDVAGALKAESTGVLFGRRKAWVRSGLVVFQVCLSFVLLVGAGLLLQSLQKIRTTSPGFVTTSVLKTAVSLVAAGYDVPRARVMQDALMDRVRALPGVQSAAYALVTPLGYGTYSDTPVAADGYDPPPNEQATVEYNQVSPDYFATLGIPLLSGREFTRTDDESAPLVAIVNRTMTERYWRGQDPVGRRLQVKGQWARVVGVAADSRYESMRETSKPFFYVPLRQDFGRNVALYIRTTLPVQSISSGVVREVKALDANLAIYEMITMQEQVDRSTSAQLVAVTLVSIMGGLALVLAGIGLYGVMSYAVAQSSRELGLRMALGADATNLLRLVVTRGIRLTAVGMVLGLATGFVLARWLGKLLFNVSPHDPLSFASALTVMMITAVTACLVPAWRATRTDPARILRE